MTHADNADTPDQVPVTQQDDFDAYDYLRAVESETVFDPDVDAEDISVAGRGDTAIDSYSASFFHADFPTHDHLVLVRSQTDWGVVCGALTRDGDVVSRSCACVSACTPCVDEGCTEPSGLNLGDTYTRHGDIHIVGGDSPQLYVAGVCGLSESVTDEHGVLAPWVAGMLTDSTDAGMFLVRCEVADDGFYGAKPQRVDCDLSELL